MSEEKKVETTVEETKETKEATVEAAPAEEKPATEAAPAVKVSAFQRGKGFVRKNGKKILGGIALGIGGLLVAGKVYKMIKGENEVPTYEPVPTFEVPAIPVAIADTVAESAVPVVDTVVPAVAEVAETVTDAIPESLGIVD